MQEGLASRGSHRGIARTLIRPPASNADKARPGSHIGIARLQERPSCVGGSVFVIDALHAILWLWLAAMPSTGLVQGIACPGRQGRRYAARIE